MFHSTVFVWMYWRHQTVLLLNVVHEKPTRNSVYRRWCKSINKNDKLWKLDPFKFSLRKLRKLQYLLCFLVFSNNRLKNGFGFPLNPHSTGRWFRYAYGDLRFSLKLFQSPWKRRQPHELGTWRFQYASSTLLLRFRYAAATIPLRQWRSDYA